VDGSNITASLVPLPAGGAYCLFDLPGQAELFMMHDNLKNILDTITQVTHPFGDA